MSDLLEVYPIVRVTAESFSELPENTRVILCVKDDAGNYTNVSWNDYVKAVFDSPPAAKVPEAKKLPELMMAQYHEAIGWNACREAMLAAQEGEK